MRQRLVVVYRLVIYEHRHQQAEHFTLALALFLFVDGLDDGDGTAWVGVVHFDVHAWYLLKHGQQ